MSLKKEDIIKEIRNKKLCENERYSNEEALLQYSYILEIFQKYVNADFALVMSEDEKKDFYSFSETILKIAECYEKLNAGKKGEKEVEKNLKFFSEKIKYIKNARFIYDNMDEEIDLIIICALGVFNIEIKNWKTDALLNEKGHLQTKTGQSFDVVGQSRRHKYVIEKILADKLGELPIEELVHSSIMWVNNNSKIKDKFKKVPIWYINTLEYEITDKEKYPLNIDTRNIDEIYDILKSNLRDDRKYPLIVENDFVDQLIKYALYSVKYTSEDLERIKREKYCFKDNDRNNKYDYFYEDPNFFDETKLFDNNDYDYFIEDPNFFDEPKLFDNNNYDYFIEDLNFFDAPQPLESEKERHIDNHRSEGLSFWEGAVLFVEILEKLISSL